MISTAIASALNTRSGASRTQPPCASFCTRRTPCGRRGRASGTIGVFWSIMLLLLLVRHEGARRDMPRRHVGVMERIEHRPQHIAFEFECVEDRRLRLRGLGVLLDVAQREIGIAL